MGNKPRKRQGSPEREFKPDVIEELVAIRIREQVPWKALPDRFLVVMDQLYPEHNESRPNWLTLQKALMRNTDMMLLPTKVHKRMRVQMEEEFDKMDLGATMMVVLQAKFGEWNLLHGRYLYFLAAESVVGDEEEGVSGRAFSVADRDRMDMLGNEVLTTLFRMGDLMKSVSLQDNSLFNALRDVRDRALPRGAVVEDGRAIETMEATQRTLAEVGRQSTELLQAINERHRSMGVGHYRERPEVEADPVDG